MDVSLSLSRAAKVRRRRCPTVAASPSLAGGEREKFPFPQPNLVSFEDAEFRVGNGGKFILSHRDLDRSQKRKSRDCYRPWRSLPLSLPERRSAAKRLTAASDCRLWIPPQAEHPSHAATAPAATAPPPPPPRSLPFRPVPCWFCAPPNTWSVARCSGVTHALGLPACSPKLRGSPAHRLTTVQTRRWR